MTLTFTYGPDNKPIAGIKITMTESDGTVTVLTTDIFFNVTGCHQGWETERKQDDLFLKTGQEQDFEK